MSIGDIDRLRISQARPRATAPSAGRRFEEAIARGGAELIRGVESVAGALPGGNVVTAAVEGVGQALSETSAGGSGSAIGVGGNGSIADSLQSSTSQSMQLLELQQEISMEQRQFTAVSNVMKARHDTAKSVINNVR